MGGTVNTADAIVPVPQEISRRAWDCAFDLGSEHSNKLGAAVWFWLQTVVSRRDPDALTWGECQLLLRMHRTMRGKA